MGRTPYLAFLWPGLPTILANGSWLGLAWATVFSVLVNLLILGSLWWPELLTTPFRNGLWLATAVFWVAVTIASLKVLRDLDTDEVEAVEANFGDATRLYLRADWFGVERTLVDLLRKNPRDVEARLMLATAWRHTGRMDEASQQLDRLELLDGAHRWRLEIYQERKLLEKAAASSEAVIAVNRAA